MKKSEAVARLIEEALFQNREREKAERLASKGGDGTKKNPYATDFGRCPRQVWYSLRNYAETNPPDAQSLANFLFGHAAEDAYANLLAQMEGRDATRLIREVRLEIGNTSGRADYILWDPELRTIIEMKSSKGWQRKYLPSKDHQKQLRFYMHAGKLGMLEQYGIHPDDCDTAVLLYIIKDATRGKPTFIPFDVLYDERAVLMDLGQNDLLLESARVDTLPPARPKEYQESKFPCSYCSYKDLCWR